MKHSPLSSQSDVRCGDQFQLPLQPKTLTKVVGHFSLSAGIVCREDIMPVEFLLSLLKKQLCRNTLSLRGQAVFAICQPPSIATWVII